MRHVEKIASVRYWKRHEKFPFHLDGVKMIRFGSQLEVEFGSVPHAGMFPNCCETGFRFL